MSDQPSITDLMPTPAEPLPNLPLLRKILDHIDAHPDEWYQREFGIQSQDSPCGTAFCIAGHALVMSGFRARLVGSYHVLFESPEGRHIDPEDKAQRVLGLTDYETMIFAGGNTRAEVQRHAELIAARAGERL